jgi:hypothetical protein
MIWKHSLRSGRSASLQSDNATDTLAFGDFWLLSSNWKLSESRVAFQRAKVSSVLAQPRGVN